MNSGSRIYVAGGSTLAGAALIAHLRGLGCHDLVGVSSGEPEPTHPGQVEDFFAEYRPEYVFLAAGPSGGIGLNRARPADLMRDNLLATTHVLDAAQRHGVRKLLYLASSCSYPRQAPQPLSVDSLWTGPLEPTCAAYASAKLAGIQLCLAHRQQHGADFVAAIPANAFGPHDDFDPDTGHVIPALIRRMHEAKVHDQPLVRIWGSGKPRREFLFAADLADACVWLMKHHTGPMPVNVGSGCTFTIARVAELVAGVVGYRGRLVFDTTRPDGAPVKMLDTRPLAALGWKSATDFRTALSLTYHWFLQHEVMEDSEHANTPLPIALSHSPGRGGDRPRLPQR